MLRAHGYFLDDYRHAPDQDRQPFVPPARAAAGFVPRPARPCPDGAGAVSAHPSSSRPIRDFDRHVAADLRDWLRPGAIEGRTAAELMACAEDRLREWRVMLPASSTLERMVTAEVTQATTDLFGKISSRLPTSLARGHRPAGRSAGGRCTLQPVPAQGLSEIGQCCASSRATSSACA